jgi:hypothetical protein
MPGDRYRGIQLGQQAGLLVRRNPGSTDRTCSTSREDSHALREGLPVFPISDGLHHSQLPGISRPRRLICCYKRPVRLTTQDTVLVGCLARQRDHDSFSACPVIRGRSPRGSGATAWVTVRWQRPLGQALHFTLGYYGHFVPEAGCKGADGLTGCGRGREICMPVETPQILPRADEVDCKVNEVGGLRKC